MPSASQPIGVFDSGLGGLTILKALKEFLPNEQFIYYGDTAHLPYGEKSAEALQSYVTDIAAFLKLKNCKMMVVACNSASTVLDNVKDLSFDRGVIVDVIHPIVDLIGNQTKFKNIAIIGTRKTINSGLFDKAIHELNKDLILISRRTPLLVPMIEEGFIDEQALFPIFKRYFDGFESTELIIPACTHYPIIYNQIESYFNRRLKVLHTPKIIAESVTSVLTNRGLLRNTPEELEDEFHLSDLTESFKQEAEMFLGRPIDIQKTLLN
jgi:glutamate racemase